MLSVRCIIKQQNVIISRNVNNSKRYLALYHRFKIILKKLQRPLMVLFGGNLFTRKIILFSWSNRIYKLQTTDQLSLGLEIEMEWFLVSTLVLFSCNAAFAQYENAKVSGNERIGVGANIQSGTFITRIDHFRPQDPRTVEMVSRNDCPIQSC